MRFFVFILACCVLVGCSSTQSSPEEGYYTLLFQTANGSIPARLEINSASDWRIINSEESIRLDSIVLSNDSFFVRLPLFDSSLQGTWRGDSLFGQWTDYSRASYSIPFVGVKSTIAKQVVAGESLTYEVTFSPGDSIDTGKGVAVLQKSMNVLTGTILTETGDYRYLEGEINNDSMWLSAFDGTHLFYLSGLIHNDSITSGIFLSGKHWKENWVARKTNNNTLRNPYSIATLRVNENPLFSVLNSAGDTVMFDSSTWKNHVSIIQIMGSWCPNCTDESRFLKELYTSHKSDDLQIIPIAFERGDDVRAACDRVSRQFQQLALPYPFYYGGKSSKEEAQKKLSFLTEVHSFPTTIFIDKKGVIRRVYTGYYGPGTHEEYVKHSSEIRSFVADLIHE